MIAFACIATVSIFVGVIVISACLIHITQEFIRKGIREQTMIDIERIKLQHMASAQRTADCVSHSGLQDITKALMFISNAVSRLPSGFRAREIAADLVKEHEQFMKEDQELFDKSLEESCSEENLPPPFTDPNPFTKFKQGRDI
jgi:hypothetical protein